MKVKYESIKAYLETNPKAKAKEVAKRFKISMASAYKYMSRVKGELNSNPVKHGNNVKVVDRINSPVHYTFGGIETIDFIEAKSLPYHLGNVIKYITRADKKGNKKEDLLKAQWYLNRAITNLK
jgi:hypothetical protein